jgi:hypothetical protein
MIRRFGLLCVLLALWIFSVVLAAQSHDLLTHIGGGAAPSLWTGRQWRAAWCRPDGQADDSKATG